MSLPVSSAESKDGPSPRRAPRPGRVFWLAFAVLWTVTSAWALASPIASGPDENAHVVKAAAVVRGDLTGTSAPGAAGAGVVTVPALYATLGVYPTCFAFQPDVPADCPSAQLPTGSAAATPTQASTWVIRNNPLYYAIVGLPTLLPPAPWVLYLMRLLSAAISSLVLAWGFRALAELSRRPLVIVGVLTALTPMVVYLNSTVNPSSLEISASLTLMASLLVLLRDPDPARLPVRAAGIAVVTAFLVNSRGLSPLYVVVLVALAAVGVGPWREFTKALLDRRTWPWLAVILASTAAALMWTLRAGTLGAGGAEHPEYGFLSTANRTLLDTGDFLTVAIGRFGWMDAELPQLVYLGYAALIGLPLLLAVGLAGRRMRLAVLAGAAVAVLLPVLLQAWQAHSVGYIWTARYSMPLYVAVGVTAGFACRDVFSSLPERLARRLLVLVATLAPLGLTIAFVANLRRYTVGESGSWRSALGGPWAPPLNGGLLLAVHVVALVVGAVLLVRAEGADEATSASPMPQAVASA